MQASVFFYSAFFYAKYGVTKTLQILAIILCPLFHLDTCKFNDWNHYFEVSCSDEKH